jgi:asparagine synthase (glutamine-hydrolysing)
MVDPDLARGAKHGFAFPVDDLYRGPLRPLAEDLLRGARSRQRGFFASDGTERLLHDHVAGARQSGAAIHALVMIELWARRVLDGDASYSI